MSFFKRKSKKLFAINKQGADSGFSLTYQHAWLLWLSQCLNISVISIQINSWMLAIIALLLMWQAVLIRNNGINEGNPGPKSLNDKPNRYLNKTNAQVSPFLLLFFSTSGCLAIFITAKEAGVLVSMIHLLSFSYVVKAFELKKRGDFYQLLLLGLFVLGSALIFNQSLIFTLSLVAILLFNLAVLLQFFSLEKSFVKNLKVISVLLGQSMILAVVLFLIFPRLSPFWQIPNAKSNPTGLSDTVKPGDIASLTRSTKLAFRAEFSQGDIPQYSQLYWRAMVLENYDGRYWTKAQKPPFSSAEQLTTQKQLASIAERDHITAITYRTFYEPSFQQYLFTLSPSVPIGANKNNVLRLDDYTLQSKDIITQSQSYQFTSYPKVALSMELTQRSRQINTLYPLNSNPRLEKLALDLEKQYPDVQSRIQAILTIINSQNYAYTLQPGYLTNNSLDQFFFDTKKGFCVHYASAFTFLMRASGVPARMVTGYMGGETNSSGNASEPTDLNYLSIYQYDAHAWSEVWVKHKGWVRVDPTGSVDPSRVNSGFSEQLLQEQSLTNNDLFSLYRWKNNALLNNIRLQMDKLDYQWTRWVVGFNTDQQYDLLKEWFGDMAPWKLALIIAAALITSMLILLLALTLMNRAPPLKREKWQVLYLKALNKLSKLDLVKPKSMTANVFAKKIRETHPELALAFTRLTLTYNQLTYQMLSETEQVKQLELMEKQYKALKNLL